MSDSRTEPISIQAAARTVSRIASIVVAALLACALGLIGILRLFSPGRPKPFDDETGHPLPGSISEKIHVDINGVQQGMFIRGKDVNNPVLLFVHGGPGMPTYFLTDRYPTDLEEYFTVCWWEQRGAGLSYREDLPRETLTVEQLVADTLEVTQYLRQRFGKEKIYLMGHSWGSYIGIQAAARAPALYYAYIGVAQVTHQLESEKLAYDYMLERFKASGNRKMVRKLEAAPLTLPDALPRAYDLLRDEAMHTLGIGTTHDMKSVITGIFLPSWFSRVYTLTEKANLWRGKFASKSILWHKFIGTDLTQLVTELDLPVYFFHGRYDYTVSYRLAQDYLEKLTAPSKGFYTFEQSAHMPIFEEPARTRTILENDVLFGVTLLGDDTEVLSPTP